MIASREVKSNRPSAMLQKLSIATLFLYHICTACSVDEIQRNNNVAKSSDNSQHHLELNNGSEDTLTHTPSDRVAPESTLALTNSPLTALIEARCPGEGIGRASARLFAFGQGRKDDKSGGCTEAIRQARVDFENRKKIASDGCEKSNGQPLWDELQTDLSNLRCQQQKNGDHQVSIVQHGRCCSDDSSQAKSVEVKMPLTCKPGTNESWSVSLSASGSDPDSCEKAEANATQIVNNLAEQRRAQCNGGELLIELKPSAQGTSCRVNERSMRQGVRNAKIVCCVKDDQDQKKDN